MANAKANLFVLAMLILASVAWIAIRLSEPAAPVPEPVVVQTPTEVPAWATMQPILVQLEPLASCEGVLGLGRLLNRTELEARAPEFVFRLHLYLQNLRLERPGDIVRNYRNIETLLGVAYASCKLIPLIEQLFSGPLDGTPQSN